MVYGTFSTRGAEARLRAAAQSLSCAFRARGRRFILETVMATEEQVWLRAGFVPAVHARDQDTLERAAAAWL